MSRVKRGVTSHARHKKVLKQAKGYRGRRKNTIRVAMQAVDKWRRGREGDMPDNVPPDPAAGTGQNIRSTGDDDQSDA